jgi:hypothetical protein
MVPHNSLTCAIPWLRPARRSGSVGAFTALRYSPSGSGGTTPCPLHQMPCSGQGRPCKRVPAQGVQAAVPALLPELPSSCHAHFFTHVLPHGAAGHSITGPLCAQLPSIAAPRGRYLCSLRCPSGEVRLIVVGFPPASKWPG